MHRVLILAIGNELLIGETLDTNTNWLCRQLTNLGVSIERAVILPDILEHISNEIRSGCEMSIDLLVTTGGLGPTDDDLTLAALAHAVGRPLELNQTAYQWLAEKYAGLAASGFVSSPEMNPARIKMAMIPSGATPITNPVGAAPAVEFVYNRTTIICLPGVPAEMRAIVTGPLQPRLAGLFGAGSYQEREIWVGCGDESVLAPILREIVAEHPNVYIKSKANKFGPELRFKIILHARGESASVTQTLDAAEKALCDAFTNSKIEVINIDY